MFIEIDAILRTELEPESRVLSDVESDEALNQLRIATLFSAATADATRRWDVEDVSYRIE